jgi:branched-chain amino acid transport system permease protein
MGLTNGPLGISGIPRPIIFGLPVRYQLEFVILSLGFAAFAYLIVSIITSSPFGRVLRGIREDEILTSSLGKNTFSFKVTAFAVSASLAALAGSLFAHYVTYIDPTSFTVMESILVISMVIIGGAGSRYGPLIGAIVLVLLPEILRFVGLPQSVAQNLRQLLYGVALVVMIVVRPRGIAGQYGFR